MKTWWQLGIEETVGSLDSNLSSGLTADEAATRLQKYGPNQLKEKKGPSPLSIFFGQFEDFIVWVLVGTACPSLL